jgi:flagellar basal-body rod protein FlgG
MVEGLFSAAAGMAAQQQRLDAISNDIANADTDGYQAERVGFQDLLYSPAGGANGASVAIGAGAALQQMGTSQVQGAMQQTGRTLDVALNGPGYLEIRQSDGSTGLTRNGSLALDSRGQLTTADGSVVQPPITVPAGVPESKIAIGSDGSVRANGRAIGKLAIVNVPAPAQLAADGNSTFTPTAASGAVRAVTGTTVRQGALEASNVNLNTEMVNMMDAQRSYSLDSEAIQLQEQMMQTANGVKQ